MQWLDHVGAQLLWNHWQRAWPARLACTDSQRDMLERVAQFTTEPPPAREAWSLAEQVDHLGVLVLHGLSHARHMLEMVGQLALDLVRLAVPRRVYTCCHLDYVAEAVEDIHRAADALRPLEIVDQAAALRHFTARLRPARSAACCTIPS